MENNNDNNTISAFQITFIILLILYTANILLIIYHFIKLILSKLKQKVIYLFYTSLLIALLSRVVSSSLSYLLSNRLYDSSYSSILKYTFQVLTFIPDLTYCLVLIFLLWIFFNTFIISHISLAGDYNHKQKSIILTNYYIYSAIIIYTIGFITALVLSLLKIFSDEMFITINSVFNLGFPFLAAVFYTHLICKYSGCPYTNEDFKSQVKKMYFIVIVWIVSRITSGIIGITYLKSLINAFVINTINDKEGGVFDIAMLALYIIICEILPCSLSLNNDILQTVEKNYDFKKREFEILIENKANSVFAYGEEDFESGDGNKADTIKRKVVQELVVQLSNFKCDFIISQKSGKRLGSIYKGSYNGIVVTIRKVEFDRLSIYSINDIEQDLDLIININHVYVNRLIGICFETAPCIYLIYTSDRIKNLKDYLIENKLSYKEKLMLIKKICKGIEYLHSNNLPHLHLSNKNILVDEKLNPKIMDYGMYNLKELAKMFINYRNKNLYSPPEVLNSKYQVTTSIVLDLYKDVCFEYEKYLKYERETHQTQQSNRNTIDEDINKNNSNTSYYYSLSQRSGVDQLLLNNHLNINGVVNIDDSYNDQSESESKSKLKSTSNLDFDLKILLPKNKKKLLSKKEFIQMTNMKKVLTSIDIYSIGLIIWEIFSEVSPFENSSIEKVVDWVGKENLRPEIVSNKIPTGLAFVIKKCWNKDYEKRYDIKELINEVDLLINENK